MLFLFGWGRGTTHDYGETYPVECPKCNNNRYWHLFRRRTWFTLFFIPAIPYENKHFLVCPVCSTGIQLQGHQIAQAKELAVATQKFLRQQITEPEYRSVMDGVAFRLS